MLSLPKTYFFFFFNDTATTEIYTLSLHDALPISRIVAKIKVVVCRAFPLARDDHLARSVFERQRHGRGPVSVQAQSKCGLIDGGRHRSLSCDEVDPPIPLAVIRDEVDRASIAESQILALRTNLSRVSGCTRVELGRGEKA